MSELLNRLPAVRGTYTPEAPLKPLTWFRVGGPAEILFEPADRDDLAHFLAACPRDVPLTVLGLGSNMLVRDGGVRGVVLKLGEAFQTVEVHGLEITAGAGAADALVSKAAQKAGIDGLAFLCGIPGTLGGALRMNAGAYGREMADIVVEVEAVDRLGQIRRLSPQDMGFSYRHTSADPSLIFTSALLRGTPGDTSAIAAEMQRIRTEREASQPVRERTGGSTFANPVADPQDRKAWELIDAAGCRGLCQGDAMVSPHHCNFMINKGNATAHDLETLGEEVRRRVLALTGIELRWEIKRIGES